MIDIFSANNQLDDLLQRVGAKLQISKTQRKMAEERYQAVGIWLSNDKDLSNDADIEIYPQGSLSINTTVKPLSRQEYDLDLVCQINQTWQGKDPLKLLNSIEKRLKDNKMYEGMVERKNRCIRLNYANEFHMDILPAYPANNTSSTNIKVPDRKAKDWKDSNPKGYTNWFNNRSYQYELLLEKRADIKPLPNDDSIERKPPLKRAVQLIKRYRDIYFEDDPDSAPISIVLTTLAGEYYDGQASVFQAISDILRNILAHIPENGKRLVVWNPTNKKEDLSERWDEHPELYRSFVTFVLDFKENWDQLIELRGINEIAEELKAMFGENVVNETMKELAEYMEKARKNDQLGVFGAGLLIVGSKGENVVPLRKNTFYGG